MENIIIKEYIDQYKILTNERNDNIIEIEGLTLYVNKRVFSPDPRITCTPLMIINKLKTIDIQNKIVLDMGCGTGILGLWCINNGADYVCSVDVDNNALENTEINYKNNTNKKKGIDYDIIKSNVFDNIEHKQYDIILFNLPICNDVWNIDIINLYDKFFSEIHEYTKKNTIAINVFAPFGEYKEYIKLLEKYKLNYATENYTYYNFEWQLFIIFL